MNILNNNGYFAAANSRYGFVSFFDKIFSPTEVDFLYIIKGGSGTGKSRLMRDIGETAAAVGDIPEYFYCSSDPMSLDGVLLKKRRVAVIDGTAPHIAEPKLPGCRDQIINLGEFWNSDILRENRDEIAALCTEKSALYKKAYSYLSAAGKLNAVAFELCRSTLKQEKLYSWAKRFVSRLSDIENGKEKIRLTSAISYMGRVNTEAFYSKSKKRFVIKDSSYMAPAIFEAIRCVLSDAGASYEISFDPLDTSNADGIFIHGAETSITMATDDNLSCVDGIINTERFFDRDAYHTVRSKVKFLHKCSDALEIYSVDTMKEIFALHGDVEKIYISAMNFRAKEKFSSEICRKIINTF